MSLAFSTSFIRVLPRRTTCLRPLAPRRPFCLHASASVAESTRAAILENNVMVFSRSTCPYCAAAKELFRDLNVDHYTWELDNRQDGEEVRAFLLEETGQRTVPNIFIRGNHVGGYDDTISLHSSGKLLHMINPEET